MSGTPAPAENRTARFARRRAEILDVASAQINVNGVRGMTLTAVARELGLDTSSVTYYFRKKDELAAACLERGLAQLGHAAETASGEADPVSRVRRFVDEALQIHLRQRAPGASPLAVLSDFSALEGPPREPLRALYREMFGCVRGFFAFPPATARLRSAVSTYMLLAVVHWMPAWQHHHLSRDLRRVSERLGDALSRGLGAGEPWPLDTSPLEAPVESSDAQARFLHAATNQINRHGYRGASVEGIASELGVSIGSFYHHLDNKDDLVAACFRRSFRVWDEAMARSDTRGGSAGDRLGVLITSLIAHQFSAASPLLRVSAYQALPPSLRQPMLARTGRVTLHVAGLISDGVADGSVRPCDALLAAHAVIAVIHTAPDMRDWASRRPLAEAVSVWARALEHGLL